MIIFLCTPVQLLSRYCRISFSQRADFYTLSIGGIFCLYSGAPVALKAAKRSPILIWERKGNPWVDLFMIVLASGISRGGVRTTTTETTTMTTTESRNMVAILQIIRWQKPETCSRSLRFTSLILNLRTNSTYMLWSIDMSISQAQFQSSACSYQVQLLKTGQDCSEAG